MWRVVVMYDKCMYDRYDECLHDCPKCPQFIKICDYCGEPIDDDEEYKGSHLDCYISECVENFDFMSDFLDENPEVKKMYEEFIRGTTERMY